MIDENEVYYYRKNVIGYYVDPIMKKYDKEEIAYKKKEKRVKEMLKNVRKENLSSLASEI